MSSVKLSGRGLGHLDLLSGRPPMSPQPHSRHQADWNIAYPLPAHLERTRGGRNAIFSRFTICRFLWGGRKAASPVCPFIRGRSFPQSLT